MLSWAYYFIVLALSLVGLAVAVLGLPGIWLIPVLVALFAWLTGATYLLWCVLALVVLGVLAEVAESALGGIAAKNAGGSKRGMIAAIVAGLIGGLIGTPILPIIGTLLGACAGAFIGAFVVELLWLKKNTRDSLAIGYASAKGRLYGMLIKLAFGIAMFMTAAVWTLPLWRSNAPPLTRATAGQILPVPASTQPAATPLETPGTSTSTGTRPVAAPATAPALP